MPHHSVNNKNDFSFIKPEHIRAGRAWLGWNLDEAQEKSGVNRDVISRFELGKKNLGATSRGKIFRAFLADGVELLPNGIMHNANY